MALRSSYSQSLRQWARLAVSFGLVRRAAAALSMRLRRHLASHWSCHAVHPRMTPWLPKRLTARACRCSIRWSFWLARKLAALFFSASSARAFASATPSCLGLGLGLGLGFGVRVRP